jgi:hypothetical protein
MKQRDFTDDLNVTKERVAQITEMVIQTCQTGFDMATKLDETNNTTDSSILFDDMGKMLKEDVKLLKSVDEGIVYGYVAYAVAEAFKKSLGTDDAFVHLIIIREGDSPEEQARKFYQKELRKIDEKDIAERERKKNEEKKEE